MKLCHEKQVKYWNQDLYCQRIRNPVARFCLIIALTIGGVVSNCAAVNAQLVFGGESLPNVGTTDAAGKTWNSMSHAALKTEALLRKPLTSALYNAQDIVEVMEALHEMGLDTVLTTSATEDSLTPDETWEIIGNSNEIGVTLTRYLRSHNAVYEVSKKGAIRFISADEMNDAIHFQTIVYRVDHLARDFRELTALADQIQSTFLRDNWEYGGGSATMQPRIQSGHRLLIVSIHYQHHLMLQQFLYELTVATTEMPAALPSSSIGAASANGR